MNLSALFDLGSRLSSCTALEERTDPAPRPGLAVLVFLSRDVAHFNAYSLALAWGDSQGTGSLPLIERVATLATADFHATVGMLSTFRQIALDQWSTWADAEAFISWCENEDIERVAPSITTLIVAARDILFGLSIEALADADKECRALLTYSIVHPRGDGNQAFEALVAEHFR